MKVWTVTSDETIKRKSHRSIKSKEKAHFWREEGRRRRRKRRKNYWWACACDWSDAAGARQMCLGDYTHRERREVRERARERMEWLLAKIPDEANNWPAIYSSLTEVGCVGVSGLNLAPLCPPGRWTWLFGRTVCKTSPPFCSSSILLLTSRSDI